MTDAELEHILLDPGIIRNRLKVYSVRKNAIAALQIQKEFGSLDAYFWNTPFAKVSSSPLLGDELERSRGRGYLVSEQNPQSLRDSSFAKELPNFPIVNHGSTIYDLPTESDISIAISKDLKKRGMSFVGSTIIYAYMQAIGMVDDHIDTCWKRVI
jgi:DNA-3-methyladenine glycosylase I